MPHEITGRNPLGNLFPKNPRLQIMDPKPQILHPQPKTRLQPTVNVSREADGARCGRGQGGGLDGQRLARQPLGPQHRRRRRRWDEGARRDERSSCRLFVFALSCFSADDANRREPRAVGVLAAGRGIGRTSRGALWRTGGEQGGDGRRWVGVGGAPFGGGKTVRWGCVGGVISAVGSCDARAAAAADATAQLSPHRLGAAHVHLGCVILGEACDGLCHSWRVLSAS